MRSTIQAHYMELIGVAALFIVLALLAALPLVALLHLVEATSSRKAHTEGDRATLG